MKDELTCIIIVLLPILLLRQYDYR